MSIHHKTPSPGQTPFVPGPRHIVRRCTDCQTVWHEIIDTAERDVAKQCRGSSGKGRDAGKAEAQRLADELNAAAKNALPEPGDRGRGNEYSSRQHAKART